jgi:feruloyl esterase
MATGGTPVITLSLAATVMAAMAATPAAADSCSALATQFHRPGTTIAAAQTIPAGSFVTPAGQTVANLPAFCRVAGFAAPTSDSHISFEVWIPASGWNQKYLQVGCGGFCGAISYSAMAEPLRRGYATAATDDGHAASGLDASWAVGHPEKVTDYGWRAVKETADTAKAIVLAFESMSARRSYFMGCSDGGREGLMEAQRFPFDFDGIVAGSPGNAWTQLMTGFLWNERALTATTAGDLAQADLDLMSNAVLAQCAGKDGGLATDKFLTNPPACRFNPEKLLCTGQNTSACLSQDKVKAIKQIFSGPPGIFPGYRTGFGEANNAADWPTWLTDSGNPAGTVQGLLGNSFFQNMVFPNSGWTPAAHSIADSARQAEAQLGATLNSTDPNLAPFKQHGGKLIQYVGWSDTGIAPDNDINYHRAVTRVMGGPEDTQDFYRLFMVPGMAHCSGGPGASAFGQSVNGPDPADPADDVLSALDHWVENRRAPDTIITTKYVNDTPAQGIAFQRPLCPYPQIAIYRGGSTVSAASFACVGPDEDDGR